MTKRPYIRLDAEFMRDAKVLRAGEQAGWLYVALLCLSASLRSDGVVDMVQVPLTGIEDWRDRLSRLEAVELVRVEDGQVVIPKWSEWQKTQQEYVKEAERKRTARVQRMSGGHPADIRRTSGGRPADVRDKTRKDKTRKEIPAVAATSDESAPAQAPADPARIAEILAEFPIKRAAS